MEISVEQQPVVRVLIVEDNDAQRQILTDLICDEGFETVACSTAAEALDQSDVGSFGVAILDQRLPEMSGTELLEHLRVRQRELRAIIHTAYGSFESARDAVNLGAFAYVEKLGHPEELVRQVHRAARAWMAGALQRSEEKYRHLVDSVQAIVWRSDPTTARFTFVSQQAEAMLGYPVEQWLDEPKFWQEHIHPEDRDWVLERCARATADMQSLEFEYRMIADDGRLVWLRDFLNIIVEDGQPTELVGVMIDITEQKQTAEALRQSEDSLKEAQHIAHLGSWELALDDDTLMWSDEMFRIHGLEPGAVEGDVQAFVATAVHPDDQAGVEAVLQQAIRDCASFERDYRIIRPDGEERAVSAQGEVLCDTDGQPVRMIGVVQDITERKKVEDALRESEERLDSILNSLDDVVWAVDLRTEQIIYISPAAEVIYGRPALDFLDDAGLWQTVIHPDDREQVRRGSADAKTGACNLEYRIVRPEGGVRWVHDRSHLVYDEQGRPLRRYGIVTDVTERREAENALRESEQSFRLMFAHNPLPMWVYDRKTHVFLDVNDAALEKYGYSREEFLSMKIEDIRPVEDIPRFREYIDTVSDTVHKVTQWKHRKKDGTILDVEVTAHGFPYRERQGRLVLANDITERTRLEKEILEISNREQRRIGQDLHDGLGQLLTGIGFRVAELEGDLQTTEGPLAADAAEVGQMVERAIAQTRALARGLDPVNVEQQGLAVALGELTLSIEEIYSVSCVFTCPDPIEVLDPEVATHVYRVAQEAINNALKHARATRVDVRLAQQDVLLRLTVSDDGIGFSTTNARGQGMGLRIMDYRARIIGGRFAIQPGLDGGTVVTCLFPHTSVQQPADNAHATVNESLAGR